MFWGISFQPRDGEPYLLGGAWDLRLRPLRPGEPSRALLFTTRRAAAEWCKTMMTEWRRDPATAHWRVRPVRVRETVTVVAEKE